MPVTVSGAARFSCRPVRSATSARASASPPEPELLLRIVILLSQVRRQPRIHRLSLLTRPAEASAASNVERSPGRNPTATAKAQAVVGVTVRVPYADLDPGLEVAVRPEQPLSLPAPDRPLELSDSDLYFVRRDYALERLFKAPLDSLSRVLSLSLSRRKTTRLVTAPR